MGNRVQDVAKITLLPQQGADLLRALRNHGLKGPVEMFHLVFVALHLFG